jgi:aspartate/glutamate racemase
MPRVIIHSLPEMGLSMELSEREQPVWNALKEVVSDVTERGARLVAIADNTTQYFTPEIRRICEGSGAEFISIAETTAEWLRARNVRRVALVGIRSVADLGRWSAYREPLAGMEVETPGPRAMEMLQDLAYQVKMEGASEVGLNRLRDILRQEVTANYVVLALTELSLLIDRQGKKWRSGKVLIDPLAIYGDAIARKYLGLPFPGREEEDR